MKKECSTHHFACDCREQKFAELERENAALRDEINAQAMVNGKGGEREARLLAEIAALRKDKERLDWLDNRCGWLTYVKEADGGPWRARCELGKDVTGFGGNARDAIDAARKESQP